MGEKQKQENLPRPEHPKPQMERKNWQNLNGVWEFAFDFGRSGRDRRWELREHLDREILVPFCPESVLSGIGYTDFIPAVWYLKQFSVQKEQLQGRVLLHFGAVDYACRVYVNGVEAGSHEGGYTSFSMEITELLTEGDNRLTVYAEDDTRGGRQPKGKQSSRYASSGCDYTRTTGIWQTVWLEFVPKTYIKQVKYYPNVAEGSILIQAETAGNGRFRAEAFWEGRSCGKAETTVSAGNAGLTLFLSEKHLWEVGKGNLYDLVLTLEEDQVHSYVGLREVRMDGYRFLLNGTSVFQRLVLDQGFYPDGIYTAPDDAALVKDIELSLAAGFNGARLHEKVFEERFLYHCDRLGYLVWGEMANWGIDLSDGDALNIYLPQWMEALHRDFNHPAIIGWCPFNETWDYEGRRQNDAVLRNLYRMTKYADPTRPCIDTSGNYHVMTDIYDVHSYIQDVEQFAACYEDFRNEGGSFWDEHSARQHYTQGLPMFVSEYGGIKWNPNETGTEGWGYGEGPESEEAFIERYRGLTDVLLDHPKMFGFCYTQLYDIEQEQNGLYYYDRTPKFDMEIFRKINSRKAAIENEMKELIY